MQLLEMCQILTYRFIAENLQVFLKWKYSLVYIKAPKHRARWS